MIKKVEDFFVKLNKVAIGSMMFIMFLLVIGNVITRYVFDFSINWVEEFTRYLMIWIAFIGAGIAMREKRHVSIDFIQEKLPNKIIPIARAINGLIIIGFMAILAYLGIQYASETMDQLSAVLRWSMGMIYMAVPISAIVFILHMVTIFREYIENTQTEDEAAEGEGGEQT